MSNPISDYHMHTPLCGHAVGEPREYAQTAVKVGLEEIGFSDHAPLVSHEDPKITMSIKQLPTYYKMMEKVQVEFKDKLRIKVGIEADFIPGLEAKTKKILDDYKYDYVIGSVHFIKNWGFDDPDTRETWDEIDVNRVYRDYYDLLRQSAQSKLFDIMGHVDLVKKFGHRASEDMTDEVTKTAKVFKDSGVVVEINTAGLRKTCKEMYPSLNCLKIYCKTGVPLTFGSDSHDPNDVGRDFKAAVELAKQSGYKEYVLFKQRKIEKAIKL